MRKNYLQQGMDNISCFFTEEDFAEQRTTFFKITKKFKECHIDWALACSCNLFFRGIVDDFHDFDFIIDSNSTKNIFELMDSLGAKLVGTGGNGYCKSDLYLHYKLNHCDIDIICGFRLITFGTAFYYKYDAKEIDFLDSEYLSGIPLISAEASFLLYAMMEGWQRRRKFKRDLLFEYLRSNCIHPQILKRALKKNELPDWIINLIHEILV